MIQSEIEKAGKSAEQIAKEVKNTKGDLRVVYSALEEAILEYQKIDGNLELIIPGADKESLGFWRRHPQGKSIWRSYAKVLHGELCEPESKLHKQVEIGISAGGTGLVAFIINILGLPTASALVIAPIAGSILALGVKVICNEGEKDI